MTTDDRDVLYKLELDPTAVLGALDQIIERFKKMEDMGDSAIKSVARSLENLTKSSNSLLASYAKIEKAVKDTNKATTEGARSTATATKSKKDLTKTSEELVKAEKDEEAALKAAAAAREQADARIAASQQLKDRQMRQVSTAMSQNAAETVRLIKLFPEIEQEIRKLVDRYGTFTATIGGTRGALTEQEREVRRLLQVYPQLAAEIDRVTNSTKLSSQEGVTIRATPTTFRAGPGIDPTLAETEARTTAARATELQKEAVERLRQAKLAEAKATRESNQQIKANATEAYKLIKLFPDVEHRIRALSNQHGTFQFAVGGSNRAMSEQEKEIRRLIASVPQLDRELKRLANSNAQTANTGIGLQASPTKFRTPQEAAFLNPFQIRELGGALEQLGFTGARTASSLLSLFGPVGLAIAGVGLAVGAVIKSFVEMAKAGAAAFKQLVTDSVEAAKGIDSVEASFAGVFGRKDIGETIVARVRQESEELGVNLDEIVRKSLPFVQSVDQALKLGEFAVGLGQLDTKQGVKGATRTLQDALVGNLQPLRKTFAISTDDIAAAQKEFGNVEGLLIGLEATLEKRGLDFEALSNTWVVAGGRMEQVLQTLKAQLGEPIVDELIENFNQLFDLTKERRGELLTVANAIGESVAGVLEFFLDGVENFLESFDEEKALRMADSFMAMGEAIKSTIRVLIGGDIEVGLDGMADAIDRFAARGEALVQMAGTLKAMHALLFTPTAPDVQGAMDDAARIAAETGRNLFEVQKEQVRLATQAFDEAESNIDAFNRILDETAEEILAYRERLDEGSASNREFAKTAGDINQALLDLTDAQQSLDFNTQAAEAAQDELDEFLEENLKTHEKFATDMEKAERDHGDKMEDTAKKLSRDLIDLEEETADKRIDAIKGNQRRIDDIMIKNRQTIRDAYTDAADKEADILRKNARKVEEIEKESTKARIKIERDYLAELDKMRRKYEFDKQEAIRANDAIAFLQIKRRYEFELKEASISKDKQVTEEVDSAQEKRDKARQQLEQEIEDAAIANQRKLRDVQQRLEDELAAQRLKHQREMEDIIVFEERKKEALNKAYERSVEDIRTTFDRRTRELQIAYDREIALVRAKEAELTAVLNQAKAAQSASLMAYNNMVAMSGSISMGGRRGGPGVRARPGQTPQNVPSVNFDDFINAIPDLAPGVTGRAGGGTVPAGVPVVVGEPIGGRPNPELIVPSSDSMVFPLRKLMFSPPRSYDSFGSSGGGSASVTIDMLDPTKMSPEVRHQVEAIITQMMVKTIQKARHG